MERTVNELKEILSCGGNIIIEADSVLMPSLILLAKKAADSGAKMIITNIDRRYSTTNLCTIAEEGKGHVTFDFRT